MSRRCMFILHVHSACPCLMIYSMNMLRENEPKYENEHKNENQYKKKMNLKVKINMDMDTGRTRTQSRTRIPAVDIGISQMNVLSQHHNKELLSNYDM
jgi:hypothetical protein